MLLCTMLCSLILITLLIFNYRHKTVIAICLLYLGIEVFTFFVFSLLAQILQYPMTFSVDIKLLLSLVEKSFSPYTLVGGMVVSVAVIMLADLMALTSTTHINNGLKILWISVVALFVFINLPEVKYHIMLKIHHISNGNYQLWQYIKASLGNISKSIVAASLLMPICCIIANYRMTHIEYKHLCLNVTMANLVIIDIFEVMLFFILPTKYMAPWNLDEMGFPEETVDIYAEFISQRHLSLILAVMFITLVICLVFVYTKPLKFFSKGKITNNRIIKNLNQNTLMLFHAYKNSFWGISQLSEQAIESPEIAAENLKIIKASSEASYKAVCRAMRMMSFSKDKSDIIDLVEFVYKEIAAVRTENIKVNVNIPYDTVYIKIGEEHLSEILKNIFQNSVDAINIKDSVKGEINVSMHCEPGSAEIKITDNGIGMKHAILKQIFCMFNSTKHSNYHFGVGLNFAYTAMNAYNGHISIKSKYGEYTTVTLLFPTAVKE